MLFLEKYEFSDLVNIMRRLRGEGGCPWDREQTHQSLKRYLIEETYEALEAVDSGAPEKMADEFGDLLLQIVFHAQIGAEEGNFDIGDVVNCICKKLLRRHPHIFGGEKAETAEDVSRKWDEIKKGEKGLETRAGELRSVSAYLPALIRAQKVQEKAAKSGTGPADLREALERIEKGLAALKSALNDGKGGKDEFGALLFALANMGAFLNAPPYEALDKAVDRFIDGFERAEQSAGGDLAAPPAKN